MSNFGEVLRKARIRAGLTQEELAEKVEVTDGYICKLETGDSKSPSRKVAVGLAYELGISDKKRRIKFLSAAGVLHDEDWEGFEFVEIDDGEAEAEAPSRTQPAPAVAGAFGAGSGLSAILSRSRTDQQQPDAAPQRRDQTIKLLVTQIEAEAQLTLTPEKRRLAERLISENARSVCEVLAKERDQ